MLSFFQSLDPLYVLAGVIAGGLVGITGVGGGSLMTPFLILICRVSAATAVGTDLIYAAVTNIGGLVVHGANRNVDWRVVRRLAMGSVPATVLTVALLWLINADSVIARSLITKVLGLALLATAVTLLFRKPLIRWYEANVGEFNPWVVARSTTITGAILGILVTLSSVGAGSIGVTALIMLYPKMDSRRVVGSDIAHAVPLTLAAGIGHSFLGSVDTHILYLLLAGSIPAIIVTSMVSARASDTAVRIALACVLIAVCLRFWFL